MLQYIGPPSQPQLVYWRSNFSVCFTAYSNPTLEVVYNVTVSVNTTELYFFLNDSQCIGLDSVDLDDPNCSPLEIVIIASNMLGESTKTEHITRGKHELGLAMFYCIIHTYADDPFCVSLLLNRISSSEFCLLNECTFVSGRGYS